MNFRIAYVDDVKTLQDLNDEVFVDNSKYDSDLKLDWAQSVKGKDYFKKLLKNIDAICLIAEENGTSIGYIAASPREFGYRLSKYIEIENMGVTPKYRSKGVGSELMKKCLEIAKERGYQKAYVNSYIENLKAISFYESSGFKKIDISLEKNI